MKQYIAALYSSGHLVTGRNHGEAFGKLTLEEQETELISGFLDPETGRFFNEDCEFFAKEVVLVRHGRCETDIMDASLTDEGRHQIEEAAKYLRILNLQNFTGLVSPYRRCLETAEIIQKISGIKFKIELNIREKIPDHEDIQSRREEFPFFDWPTEASWHFQPEEVGQFLYRIFNILNLIPDHTLIVSHSDFILNFLNSATGQDVSNNKMPFGSVTIVKSRDVVCVGENKFERYQDVSGK